MWTRKARSRTKMLGALVNAARKCFPAVSDRVVKNPRQCEKREQPKRSKRRVITARAHRTRGRSWKSEIRKGLHLKNGWVIIIANYIRWGEFLFFIY